MNLTLKPIPLNSALQTLHRTRRAYIGAYVMAFEFAQKRANLRLDQLKAFGESLVKKGEEVENSAVEVFDAAKDKVVEILPLSDKGVTEDLTRAKKKAKTPTPADMSTDISPKAKAATSKASKTSKSKTSKKTATSKTSKKTATSKTASIKKAAAKTTMPNTVADEIKVETASDAASDKYESYVEAVVKYDANAKPELVKKIVDHLGAVLDTRDGKFVACSDAKERADVVRSWLVKKLGVEGSAETLDAKVAVVCDIMKADRMKNRVTFYYLLAKNAGMLVAL